MPPSGQKDWFTHLIPFACLCLQDVSKGLVAEKIFSSMHRKGKQADFVLCVGDDRSDEDMFEIVSSAISRNILASNASVFACTVGQKPSKAKYYLDDTTEVTSMLESLAEESDASPCIEETGDSSWRPVWVEVEVYLILGDDFFFLLFNWDVIFVVIFGAFAEYVFIIFFFLFWFFFYYILHIFLGESRHYFLLQSLIVLLF